MLKILDRTGSFAGGLGVILCLISGLVRIAGYYHISDFEALTVFQGGIGLMVFGCLMKLESISGSLVGR